MSNFTTALTGLQNTMLALDSVSSNIANANTVGYKSGEYVFTDQFAKTGVSSDQSSARRPMLQGAITNSSNPLDLAISGKGMFRLLKGSGNAMSVEPGAVYYSRNGQFGVDKQGYIVNENGMYLTGFQPTLDGNEITDDLIKNNGLLRMPASNMPGNQTSNSQLSTMLDSTSTAFTTSANVPFDPSQSTFNNKTTQTVFDSEGNSHTLEVYYRRINDSSLSITSGTGGYTYSPSSISTPNTLGTSSVVLSKDSVLRVNTSPLTSGVSSATSTGTAVALSASPTNAGLTVLPTAGMKIFINGIDSGATVTSYTGTTVTASDSIPVPYGAAVTFYGSDNTVTGVTVPITSGTATKTLTVATTNLKVGDKLYLNGTDTLATIASIGSGQVTLSSSVYSTTTPASAVFKHPLDLTLITPDGTEITLSGATNKNASLEILTSAMAQVEVFASIDNKFYDYQDASTFSDRKITPATPGVTGYNAVAKLNFIGGHNIDSLVTDAVSGTPLFQSVTTLSSRLTNQAGGNTDLLFKLDLSDTSLVAGPFQVTNSTQDGEALASLTSVSVDNEGRIVGVYGSGKQQYVGQVALVNFNDGENLTSVGKNAFAANAKTGTEQLGEGVTVGRAGTGIFGEIKSQALESSNVDLANELVRLMVLQRSYSANAQAMKAFDQTMRDTMQMIG
jgi:flagellar hook protein FlgE